MDQQNDVTQPEVSPVNPSSMPVMPPVQPATPAPSPAPAENGMISGVVGGLDAAPAGWTAPVANQTDAAMNNLSASIPATPVAESAPVLPAATVAPVQPAWDANPAPVMPPVELTAPVPALQDNVTAQLEAPTMEQGAKVLVVEDEIDARTMFVDLLSSEGYEVSSAVDGVDALAKAAADKFDLILLDIVMPNKDGIEVLQEIKQNPDKYGQPVVVMLTNISGDAAVEKAMELGAAGFKLKVDTEPVQLLADIRAFLSGKVQNVQQEPVSRSLT